MALASPIPPAPPQLLTYEQYRAEGEINRRYDIIDGVRIFMPSPNRRHQDRVGNIYEAWRAFQRATRRGKTYQSSDVLISHIPLRTRQPDVFFISNERLANNTATEDGGEFDPAPELIVEVRSPSETDAVLAAKLVDYQRVNVLEAWIVYMPEQAVEVLTLSPSGWQIVARYGMGQVVQSLTFPDLNMPVTDIFAAP